MKELARIKLSNGYSIVFNQGVEPEMPNEVRVDIYDKEDTWTQDLARIGNYFEGEDENEIIYDENKFLVQVPIQFNTLEQFTIDLRKDPEFTEEELNDEDDDEIEDKLIEREESDEVEAEEYEDEGEEIEEESVKPGDRGEKVKEIQQKLKDLGYFNGQVKGNYLTITTNAVKAFQKDVIDYINAFQDIPVTKQVKIDAEARKQVELAAVKFVTEKYKRFGYQVTSREKENIGWDLDAAKEHVSLKLEVKGLAQSQISVRISNNEYKSMMNNKDSYRLCVVTNAIQQPVLTVFIWDSILRAWVSDKDQSLVLSIEERPSYLAEVE
jgi:hypothetical protein